MHSLTAFLRCSSAATAIEYALIAGIVSLSVVAGARLIGESLAVIFADANAPF